MNHNRRNIAEIVPGISRIFLVLFFLVIISAGCDMFSTRSPEEPGTGKSTFKPPTAPEDVVSNFINSIKEKNVENYLKCFSDSAKAGSNPYTFIPSSDARAKYPGVFDNWDKNSERIYFHALIAGMQYTTPYLSLSKHQPLKNEDSETAELVTDYTLSVTHNISGTDTLFTGNLRFIMKKGDDNYWSITEWSDNRGAKPEISTWSILKAQLAK